jgi:hypothetical protein
LNVCNFKMRTLILPLLFKNKIRSKMKMNEQFQNKENMNAKQNERKEDEDVGESEKSEAQSLEYIVLQAWYRTGSILDLVFTHAETLVKKKPERK